MKIDYEQELESALARAGMDGKTISVLLVRHKLAVSKGSNEIQSFLSFVDSYANEDAHVLLGSLIENALRKASETKIETNSLVRLKEKILRHNATMDKAKNFGIEGGSPLNPEQLKMKMPSFINGEPEHEAKANYKTLERLEFEVR
jgi:hypothetical protein